MKRTNGYSTIRPFAVQTRRVFCTPDGTPIGKPRQDIEKPDPAPILSSSDVLKTLEDLAYRARRLRPPMSSNPSAFHEDKSELARDIDRLADALRIRPTI